MISRNDFPISWWAWRTSGSAGLMAPHGHNIRRLQPAPAWRPRGGERSRRKLARCRVLRTQRIVTCRRNGRGSHVDHRMRIDERVHFAQLRRKVLENRRIAVGFEARQIFADRCVEQGDMLACRGNRGRIGTRQGFGDGSGRDRNIGLTRLDFAVRDEPGTVSYRPRPAPLEQGCILQGKVTVGRSAPRSPFGAR